jgi:hypothetical protein
MSLRKSTTPAKGNTQTTSHVPLFAVFLLLIRIGSGFNQVTGSGSKRAKMTHKNRKFKKFMF